MRALSAFLAGALFSAGLVVAGMTQPANIVGFLDFFGNWKPALALVMGGAVSVYAALYPLVIKRRFPLFAPSFDLPAAAKIDARLLAGAGAFGIGWGLGGFCPGPALAALGAGGSEAAVFSAALAAGVILHHFALQNGTRGAEGPKGCG